MPDRLTRPHPYMANSNDAAHAQLLAAIGVDDVEVLFEQIPADQRTAHDFAWPPALPAEAELSAHLNALLDQNTSCGEQLSFLGRGVYQHYVPAVVDAVISRSEFLTPVWGTPSSDQGRMQAWFEFTSQLGELLDLEFVGLPVYSYGTAAGHALRLAARITGRDEVVVPRTMDPERLAVVRTYAGDPGLPGSLRLVTVDADEATGRIDLDHLARLVGETTAAVYVETPNAFGVLEAELAAVCEIAHHRGAQAVVGVDPVCLGVVTPPARLGADIVVGSLQALGVHMNGGGGVAGFIASRDEERYARQFPTLQVSITPTPVPGELSFGLTLFEQSSYGARENGNDWTGNGVYLWAIAAAVHMSLMGPQGFVELGATILERTAYAARRLAEIPGVRVPWATGAFRELLVEFDDGAPPAAEIIRRLLDAGIFGGVDVSGEVPGRDNALLVCVTEVHSAADIDVLVGALTKAVQR